MKLTRFEYTRIISARSLQIVMGAPVLVSTKSDVPKEIAVEEYNAGVLPIVVKRPGMSAI